ncbi:50S ribosomal protein L29 [Oxynema aestuarii]|jgi:large subunit ribosomal protein L29|uniref:Large ribosomal subunit protein uL29 n=1 Tax=Oxynema aestuarii AP17 TaxID=2064643 RepID=A0A6H1TUU0_9CYAN|nr:50S ribosomal protein L29 [Oxynema aestuarii]QIZ70185.1 50S ribosomal protein L29 [Oxynema aestuarii AP17]RMH76444.1 MAG: 50S ribosomal protein L29 [Cyanobacteria bacterium J007]
MSFPKISEVRELSDEALAEEIASVKRELFQLRLKKATGQLEGTHHFKHLKHKLAQMLTVEGERQRQAASSSEASSTTESQAE